MFKKVLVANRGEIALRIIRACKELGIATVAVHSEADADSLHVRFSDEDVCIGPAPASESYLHIPSLIAAAEVTNADAIHPGYGFLAENAHFAEVCEECGITFIGPTAGMIRAMGDKALAREKMKSAGVPVIPGSEGILKDHNDALAWAKRIGYPVILKATAGGGGKGMRIVRNPSEMEKAFQTATAESAKAFNNGDMYIEKFFEKIRHIEVQLLGDKHGHVVHLGERDCSVQRKHQKLIEESPSPVIDEKTRQKLGKIAARGARKVGYDSVGTMEFIMDEKDHFYFMEMNTRIQVEHTVTEMVTGLDLIMDQIASAAGEKLAFTKNKCALRGHSIECRINAEDPDRNFMPCPGRITDFHVPGGPGVRVDTHVYTNYVVPPYYDSMIAKLIVGGRTRQEAILRMERALDEFIIEGIKTTIPFHKEVLKNKKFRKGGIFTSFLEELQDTKKK